MTSGWRRIAPPWKANSSTSVASNAPVDQGPMLRHRGIERRRPLASRARRSACAIPTGITM